MAVDPTSPFTGGAILGDRVRMQAHAGDAGVFIRSMATRGHLGGLARATSDAALVLDAAGRDFVIIETVGVGQDEVDIVRTADVSIVVLVPGTGDDVQALKAGIMEIADIFVVNKADREGADRTAAGVEAMLSLASFADDDWRPPILKTEATTGAGVPELVDGHRSVPAARAGAAAGSAAARGASSAFASSSPPGSWRASTRARPGRAGAHRRCDQRAHPRSLFGRARHHRPAGARTPRVARADAGTAPAGTATEVASPSIALGQPRARAAQRRVLRARRRRDVRRRPEAALGARGARRTRATASAWRMRPLLVRGERTVLIDAGCGDKMDAKAADIYGFDRDATPRSRAGRRGRDAPQTSIVVVASHLHFDHAGGFTARGSDGIVRPRFPRARYIVRARRVGRRHRTRTSGTAPATSPRTTCRCATPGVLTLVEEDGEVAPGIRVRRTGGHTMHHQIVLIESGGKTAVFMADLHSNGGPRAAAVDHGLRPLPDGHARVQARVPAGSGRARVPGLLRARSRDESPGTSANGAGGSSSSARCDPVSVARGLFGGGAEVVQRLMAAEHQERRDGPVPGDADEDRCVEPDQRDRRRPRPDPP